MTDVTSLKSMVLSVFLSLKELSFSKGVFRTFPNIDDVLSYAKIANGSIMNFWQDSNYTYSTSSAEMNFLPVFVMFLLRSCSSTIRTKKGR